MALQLLPKDTYSYLTPQFTADGKQIVFVNPRDQVNVWDLASQKVVLPFKLPPPPAN